VRAKSSSAHLSKGTYCWSDLAKDQFIDGIVHFALEELVT
jgi:hypothetical protein